MRLLKLILLLVSFPVTIHALPVDLQQRRDVQTSDIVNEHFASHLIKRAGSGGGHSGGGHSGGGHSGGSSHSGSGHSGESGHQQGSHISSGSHDVRPFVQNDCDI